MNSHTDAQNNQDMRRKYKDFLAYPQHDDIRVMLKTYIENCIPDAAATVNRTWTLSCLSTIGASQRLTSIQVYGLEVLAVYTPAPELKPGCKLSGFINLAALNFFDHDFDYAAFLETYPSAFLFTPAYYSSSASPVSVPDLSLELADLRDLLAVVQQPKFQQAALNLNQAVVAAAIPNTHNPILAEYVLG